MELLSSFGKQGIRLGLLTQQVDIEDTDASSKYFAISEFNPVFTAGKNAVSFNGSPLLKSGTEVLVECLDSKGNSLFIQQAKAVNSQYTDAAKFVISIQVFGETYNGVGKLILVGKTNKNEVVRWISNITIDKTLTNNSKVRFYHKPTLEVRPILYPVVDTDKAQTEYPPPPATAVALATATISSTVISVSITGTGIGYTTATVQFYGGNPAIAATGNVVIANGSVSRIDITNGGAGYKSSPSVIITGTNTTPASATAILKSEVVSAVVNAGGSGYTFVPRVVFTPVNGAGSGALATATMVGGVITAITLDYGGNGYVNTPNITFDYPVAPPAPDLNIPVNFSSSFYAYAGNPVKDTNKNTLNAKRTDIDYRLVIGSSTWQPLSSDDFGASNFPVKVFNTQMEGKELTLHISKVQLPYSVKDTNTNITASYLIKKVINSSTIQLSEPYFSTHGKNQLVSNITQGRCFLDYKIVLYNTNPDSNLKIVITPSLVVDAKESHAEVTYRNIECFSGLVARHKLYRKSSYYPGEFQLISDELLGTPELLTDPVTFNKFYEKMGVFYNQTHVDKYWCKTSSDLVLEAVTSPINGMKMSAATFDTMDGTLSAMVKNDSIGGENDNIYYPYNADQYNNLSGFSYNSNFISLKKDSLYSLSTRIQIEKDPSNRDSRVEFYFTSSISSIRTEKNYDPRYGLLLGKLEAPDNVPIKYFDGTQTLYVTPVDDYFGTLVIVPYHCNVILSELSMKVYGDHGFSPDVQVLNIPFSVNVANEAFDIKAELLDLNSNVVYSNLRTVQTFDSTGESLYINSVNSVNSVINITTTNKSTKAITISGEPYFPNLPECDNTTRIVGWHVPVGDDSDGKLCYTTVSSLYISGSDYISLSAYTDGVEGNAKAIAVRYDFASIQGRKIFIDASGNKETFP